MKASKKDINKWAKRINREIFGKSINLQGLRIINKRKDKENPRARGWYYPESNKIVLIGKEHKTDFDIFHTIAHELIHVYQAQCGFDFYHLNHGGKFFRYYKEKICSAYGIKNDWMF